MVDGIYTGTTNFDKTLVALVRRQIQENLRTQNRWVQPDAIVMGKIVPGTDRIRFPGYSDLSVTDSLVAVEGTATAAEALTIGYEDVQALQRMRSISLTDVAMDMSPHDLYGIAAERVAFNALAVADFVVAKTVLASTLNDYFLKPPAAGVVTFGTDEGDIEDASVLNALTVRRIVALLKKAEIPPFGDGFYRAMIDPNIIFDLQSDTAVGGWIEASKYAAPEQLLNGEIGRIAGVRFIESNRTELTASLAISDNEAGGSNDVPWYKTVFYGPQYAAFGDLQSVQSFLVRPGGDHGDVAAQRAVVSWKGMYGVAVLGAATQTPEAGPRHLILNHAGSIPTGVTA